MAHKNQCPLCGAYLDFGEKCDCREEKDKNIKKIASVLTESSDGQIALGGLIHE